MEILKIKSNSLNKSYSLVKHPSGLNIYLYKMPGFSSHYGLFGTKYGSIDNSFVDEKGEEIKLPEGIAHFLEHKLFESEDGDAFTKYAKTGAYSNAYTSFDRTCYLFSCSNKFYDNLKILLEFVRSPYFTADTVSKEQGIIGQEIRMYDDMPSWRVLFNMLEGMFYEHPVKIDIAGTTDSIAKITDKLLYSCYNKFYDLSNMFLVLGGDFKEAEVISFINKHLSVPEKSEKVTPLIPKEPNEPKTNEVTCNLDVAKPLFCLGFKEDYTGKNPDAERLVAMEILLKALVGPASPLYKELLEKKLINEEFSVEYFTGRTFSLPIFEGESDNPKMVAELIIKKAEEYKKHGIEPKLFEAIRRELYGKAIRRFDSAENVCSMISDSVVLEYDLFEHFELLKSISKKEVEKYLEIFTSKRSVLSIVNPKSKQ